MHWSVSAPSLLPLHLASVVQSSEHDVEPHSVLQSAPATHSQSNPVHAHPAPVHVALPVSPPSLPHPAAVNTASATSQALAVIVIPSESWSIATSSVDGVASLVMQRSRRARSAACRTAPRAATSARSSPQHDADE